MAPKTTQTPRKTLSLTFDLRGKHKKYLNLIVLHLIWQHTNCLLWLILLLFKYIITVLFNALIFLYIMFIKLGGPIKLLLKLIVKKLDYSPKSQFVLHLSSFKAKNRWHGTLTPRPTKKHPQKQPQRLLLHSNPKKFAYFSNSIRGQWSHSSCTENKTAKPNYTEKPRRTATEVKRGEASVKYPIW